jgi:hypothetical protein
MAYAAAFCPVLLLSFLAFPDAEAPPFAIDVIAQVGKVSKTAHAAEPPKGFSPRRTPIARPVLEAGVGEAVTVRWSLTRGTGQPALKNVLVHFFVAPEDKAGQAAVPKGDKNNPVESALVMDFKAGNKAEGEITLKIDRPGAYLLRLETIGASDVDGRESYAALDLVLR